MARPRSIFERFSKSTLPPPEYREQVAIVQEGDVLLALSNRAYFVEEYDPALWRGIGLANNVLNPFRFSDDFIGERIRIPSKPLPTA